ncbi:VanZ family protein [Actinomadura rupiterrae]|uniref:VanZ family protein n=1 Tax=Actinomadura rupiterrae TaxID=559627 RepID=UPI0020A44B72|nr:VanZ family protein [Actinomadura rupiterrae]MCP2343122.1 hypothetical protein [Actinomadura rupiterrae]
MLLRNWYDLFGTFTGVVLLTLAALPVAVLAVWALSRRRIALGGTLAGSWLTSLSEIGLVYGTVPPVWLTLLPGGPSETDPHRVSLVPFHDMSMIIAAGPMTAAGQIGGNLLVFASLGFFGPLRFPALASVPRILALAATCSTTVETAQYVLRLDRVASVDDVLLNTAGAGLAALASLPLRHVTAAPALSGAGPR